MVIRTFDIFENGERIFRGTTAEIEKQFGGCCANLNYYVKKGTLWRCKYKVKVFQTLGTPDLNVWDVTLDGKRVFTGTDRQIAERFGLAERFRGSKYYKHAYKIKNMYRVFPHEPKREDAPKDPLYEQTKWLIEHFHNAYLRKDAERIQQKLLEEGISTELRQTSDRKGYVLWAA